MPTTCNSQKIREENSTRVYDDIGHLGLEQMLHLLCNQFYLPEMTKDVEVHIINCDCCIHFKR